MQIALTHLVSPHLDRCELSYYEREPIDLELAGRQHKQYCAALTGAGLEVLELAVNRSLPDSVFVEDTAVVVDEVAVLTRPGAPSRRPEVPGIGKELAKYRPLLPIEDPATLDGGDVLQVGRRFFVGLSTRTNLAGAEALQGLLAPHGYQVTPVPLRDCLHLKATCTALDEATLLVNPDRLDTAPLAGCELVPVPRSEPEAANCLRIGETVLLPASHPRTAARVSDLGYQVRTLDISELQKAEAGLTCCSLIFRFPVAAA